MNASRKLQIAVLGMLLPVLYLYPSEEGKDAIKAHEGYLEASYSDLGGVSTICWGSTKGVKPNSVSTPEECAERLEADLHDADAVIKQYVTHDLTQKQYDAVLSFVFNIGGERFRTSTLLKRINSGDCPGAVDQFQRWVLVKGKVAKGLQNRRAEEAKMFKSGCAAW